MRYEDLAGKVALITGASRRRGIGAGICRALAAQGVAVAFTAWTAYDDAQPDWSDPHGPESLLWELTELGVPAISIEANLADPAAPPQVLAQTIDGLGYPHILINNAAHSMQDGYERLDAATLDAHYAVNVRGMALLCAEFARGWPARSDGRIINLTSGQSLGPMPGELAYAATKGAVEAFTRSLAAEVASLGITVNAVDPGATDTGWMDDGLRTAIAQSMRMGRVGMPEDIARLVVFLASAASGWITGQVLYSRGM